MPGSHKIVQNLTSIIEEAYPAYSRQLVLTREIDQLTCSTEGLQRLSVIARELRENLNRTVTETFELSKSIVDPQVIGDTRFLITYVVRAFCRNNIQEPPEVFSTKIETELSEFQQLIIDLIERKVDVPYIFFIALLDPQIQLQQIWASWCKQYVLVVKKAKQFKKKCLSNCNRSRSFYELPVVLKEAINKEYGQIFELLNSLIAEDWFKEQNRLYRAPGGYPRKQHRVWLPVLKQLVKELENHFIASREWEYAGGLRQGKVVPDQVWDTITKILHFCHPQIWDISPNTIASVKARFHRHRS